MTPENTFIGSVHNHLPPITKLYRMKNNNMYVAGIADCWYSGPIADLWIEWKFIKVPTRDETPIDLVGGKNPTISALQQDWIKERRREGRRVLVGVGSKDGGVIFDGTWHKSILAKQFRHSMLTRKELAAHIVSITGAHPA